MAQEVAKGTQLDSAEAHAKSERGYKAANGRLQKEVKELRATLATHQAENDARTDAIVEKSNTIDTDEQHNNLFKRDPWVPKCTGSDCNTKNPKWKDETECKSCKYPLGAVETLPEIDSCPGCSKKGDEFSAVRKNEEE